MRNNSASMQATGKSATLSAGPPRQSDIQAVAMSRELASGRAQYLSATIRDFIRLQDAWWISDRDIWFTVDDQELINSLNAAARLMAVADQPVISNSVER